MSESYKVSLDASMSASVDVTNAFGVVVAVGGGGNLSWSAPEATPAGSSPSVTGYEIWEETSPGVWALDSSVGSGVTSATVTDGTYAVRATFSGGRTALSNPVEVGSWLDNLPAVTVGNTVESTDSQATIQAAIDALSAGDTLYLDGGTYSHSASGAFITIGVSGTSGNEINIVAKPGTSPIIEGEGWADDDVGPTADQGGLVTITGDFIRLYGVEIKDSNEDGLRVTGDDILVKECHIHDNWENGVNIEPTAAAVDSVSIEHCKITHNRIAGGIALRVESGQPYFIDNVTVKQCIIAFNGWDSNTSLNIYGGGNSDAVTVFKDAHQEFQDNDVSYETYNRANGVRNLHLLQNISYQQGDDGFDINSGDGTILNGNISLRSHPSGGKDWKIFNTIFEDHSYIGNVALGSLSLVNESNEIYFSSGGTTAISVSDTITGDTSGATATVDEVDIFTNAGGSWAGGNASGRLKISSLSGNFRYNEGLEVSAQNRATVRAGSAVTGKEGRVSDTSIFFQNGSTQINSGDSITGATSGATATVTSGVFGDVWAGDWATNDAEGFLWLDAKSGTFQDGEDLEVSAAKVAEAKVINSTDGFPIGKNHEVNWTTIQHNMPSASAQRGFSTTANADDPGGFVNNLSYYNKSVDSISNYTQVTSHINNNGSAPGIHDTSYDASDVSYSLSGTLIEDEWRNFYRDIMENIMATDGGNLENAGTKDTDYHHTNAADDSSSPSDPGDLTKMHWHGTSPDIGASQFCELWPPVLS